MQEFKFDKQPAELEVIPGRTYTREDAGKLVFDPEDEMAVTEKMSQLVEKLWRANRKVRITQDGVSMEGTLGDTALADSYFLKDAPGKDPIGDVNVRNIEAIEILG